LNDKAWLYYKLGYNEEALINVNQSIDIYNGDLAAALDTKGMALAALGNNEEALGYINQALELDPLNSIVWIHKGNILKAMGNTSGSEAAFAKVKELPAQNLNNASV
jgi:tetratricopeptide (TPR) repeat protein